jgi:hypothetical protein
MTPVRGCIAMLLLDIAAMFLAAAKRIEGAR